MPTIEPNIIRSNFKPGQLYHNEAEQTIYLILEVKPSLVTIRCMQFEDVSYILSHNISNTITIKSLHPKSLLSPRTILKTGKPCLDLYREAVLHICKTNLIDTAPIQTLWNELDKNRFEVGLIYESLHSNILNHYLCIDIDNEGDPLFLNYNCTYLGECQLVDDILDSLELVSEAKYKRMLKLFQEELDKQQTCIWDYQKKVSSYISRLS